MTTSEEPVPIETAEEESSSLPQRAAAAVRQNETDVAGKG